jgi:uncharacterized Ntn-hydrolase superfamily protein
MVTFSILLRDPTSGEIGGGVASRFLAVGALVLYAQAGYGAIATQALINASFGPRGVRLLELGVPAADVVRLLASQDEQPSRRQLGALGVTGAGAAHTGDKCQDWAGHLTGERYTCQGNILASARAIEAMAAVAAAHQAGTPVADTVLSALRAADVAGGDKRGRQSAAVLVVRPGGGYGGTSDTVVDLRVDDHPQPLGELHRLMRLHQEIFSRPAEGDLIPLAGQTLTTVATQLAQVTGEQFDHADASAVWQVLDRWAGRENLEERLIRQHAVDDVLLKALQRQAGESQ